MTGFEKKRELVSAYLQILEASLSFLKLPSIICSYKGIGMINEPRGKGCGVSGHYAERSTNLLEELYQFYLHGLTANKQSICYHAV